MRNSTPIPWRDPYPPARPRPAAAVRGSKLWLWLIGLTAAGLVLLLAAAVLAVPALGLIAPGVRVGDTRLDWQTRAQAARLLDSQWNQPDRSLLLTDGTQNWAASPQFFGLYLDPAATAQAAYEAGRDSAAGWPLAAVQRWLTGETISVRPAAVVDAAFAHAQLTHWAGQINRPAVDASLSMAGGQLVVTPPVDGTNLDVQATLTRLVADPVGTLERGTLEVSMQPVSPRVRDVSAAYQQALDLLNRPVSASVLDPVAGTEQRLAIPPEVVASWLRVDAGPDGPAARLDVEAARAYLPALEPQLGAGRSLGELPDASAVGSALQTGSPIPLRIRYLPTEYVIQPGDTLLKIGWKVGIPYWRITRANPGLDTEHLTPGKILTIPAKDELLPLPVIPGKRIIISISEQRMWVQQDGSNLREFKISTGIDRSPTQPGIFQVQGHDLSAYASVWDLTMPHFLSIYEAWPGFFNGIHGLPTLSNGTRLWGSILGRPASYGCIILDLESAEWLYGWAEDGVIVEIRE